MPTLEESLQGRDLGALRIIADLWGVDLQAPDARVGVKRLAPLLLESELVQEVVLALPEPARLALAALNEAGGRLPWAVFTRRFGRLREMGAARRDRERPYTGPQASTTELLWYRGLIGRGFFETENGVDEFAYLPDELQSLLPPLPTVGRTALGRPASPAERHTVRPADDSLLDDAATFLAGRRIGLSLEALQPLLSCGRDTPYPLSAQTLQIWLQEAGLLNAAGEPLAEPTRAFLEAERGQALLRLYQTWQRSLVWDELRALPGLQCEGEWRNDPLRARHAILGFLATIPGASGVFGEDRPWWSLAGLIAAIRQTDPDFQRTAGEYDTWYIRDLASGEYLRGYLQWDAVEGRLIRFLICGPLHWLGVVDLAGPEPEGRDAPLEPAAFRFSRWAAQLFLQQPPAGLSTDSAEIVLRSDGRLSIPRSFSRAGRYQLSRFCRWEGRQVDGTYLFRLEPKALERAIKQGLTIGALRALLRRYARQVPPAVERALTRWEREGRAARIEPLMVLRLKDPALLNELRQSKAARFLGDPLGPTAITVKPGAVEKVRQALFELGVLTDFEEESGDETAGKALKKPPE